MWTKPLLHLSTLLPIDTVGAEFSTLLLKIKTRLRSQSFNILHGTRELASRLPIIIILYLLAVCERVQALKAKHSMASLGGWCIIKTAISYLKTSLKLQLYFDLWKIIC